MYFVKHKLVNTIEQQSKAYIVFLLGGGEMINYYQTNIFNEEHQIDVEHYNRIEIRFSNEHNLIDYNKFSTYNLINYKNDIANIGLEQTWEYILQYALSCKTQNPFLLPKNFAELYEIGLALKNKCDKKQSGQYYTPDDVAAVMSNWLRSLPGEAVCDVACGTGKLILTFLDCIGKDNALTLLQSGLIYLYDNDKTALKICKTILLLKYGVNLEKSIHAIHCDFLSRNVVLPTNCKVISNPPYALIDAIDNKWDASVIAKETKESYAMFMEKIIMQSRSSVIITPYSFLGGNKFYSLRKFMNNYNGFIVSFDNVPGNIFCGRKHGIFNTNTANSVRASITVVENKSSFAGFRISPLIRFKNEERNALLQNNVLESFLNNVYQMVSSSAPMYCKCNKNLTEIWDTWQNKSTKTLGDYISKKGKHILSMPNTCRYFTSASKGILNRKGQITLTFDDIHVFNYVFCMLNSSFAYWYWRNYDGGITYSKRLLLKMPLFYDRLTDTDVAFFDKIATIMIQNANQFVITKNNIGVQENIKYPREYRDKINHKILEILGCNISEREFDVIHSNMALEVNV